MMQDRWVCNMNGALVVVTKEGRMMLTDSHGDCWELRATGHRHVPFDIVCVKRGVKVDGVQSDTPETFVNVTGETVPNNAVEIAHDWKLRGL